MGFVSQLLCPGLQEEAASLAAELQSSKQEVDQLSAASNESKEHLQSELATAQVRISRQSISCSMLVH